MPKPGNLLGYLPGVGDDAGARVAVYKAGRTYRLVSGGQTHLCHPSVTSIARCQQEALLALNVETLGFDPV